MLVASALLIQSCSIDAGGMLWPTVWGLQVREHADDAFSSSSCCGLGRSGLSPRRHHLGPRSCWRQDQLQWEVSCPHFWRKPLCAAASQLAPLGTSAARRIRNRPAVSCLSGLDSQDVRFRNFWDRKILGPDEYVLMTLYMD